MGQALRCVVARDQSDQETKIPCYFVEIGRTTTLISSSYLECQPHILPLIPALASHREESPQRHRKNQRIQGFPDKKNHSSYSSLEPAQFQWAAQSQTPSTPVSQSSRHTRECGQRRADGRERHPRGRLIQEWPARVSLQAPNETPRIGCRGNSSTKRTTELFENTD